MKIFFYHTGAPDGAQWNFSFLNYHTGAPDGAQLIILLLILMTFNADLISLTILAR